MHSCTMPVRTQGALGICPQSPRRGRECPKKIAHYMCGNGLVEFGVFRGVFGVVLGASMDRTTVMLTVQIRKRVCLAL